MLNPKSPVVAFLQTNHLDTADGIQIAEEAVEQGRVDVLEYVLSSPSLTQPNLENLAIIAASEGEIHILKSLIANHLNLNSCANLLLQIGTLQGHCNVTELILEMRPELKKEIPWLSELAAQTGQVDVLECLLKNGLDLPHEGMTLASKAAEYGHVTVLEWLTNKGINLQQNNNQLAKHATRFVHVDVMEFLLKHHATGSDLFELAKLAAQNGRTNILECLMSYDPSIAKQDLKLAKIAAEYGRINAVEFLGERGVKFAEASKEIAKHAIKYGHTDIVDLLILHNLLDPTDIGLMSELASLANTCDQTDTFKFLLKNCEARELIAYHNYSLVKEAATKGLSHHVAMLLDMDPEIVNKKEVNSVLTAAANIATGCPLSGTFKQKFFDPKSPNLQSDKPIQSSSKKPRTE